MAVSFVSVGAAHATTIGPGTMTPDFPASLQADDLLLLEVAERGGVGTDDTAMPSTPAGWTLLYNDLNPNQRRLTTFYKFATGSETGTVSVVSNAAAGTGLAQIAAFRGVDLTWPTGIATGGAATGATQDIGPFTGADSPAGGAMVVLGVKGSAWTSVATLSGDGLTWAEIAEPTSALGNTIGLVWDYALSPSLTTITSKTFTVTGGVSSNWVGRMFSLVAASGGGPIWPPADTPPAPPLRVARSNLRLG